jgi:hypothetical protein
MTGSQITFSISARLKSYERLSAVPLAKRLSHPAPSWIPTAARPPTAPRPGFILHEPLPSVSALTP